MKNEEECLSCTFYFVQYKQTIFLPSSEYLSYSCRKLNITKWYAFAYPIFVSIFAKNMQYKVELEKYFSNIYHITDNFAGIEVPVIISIFRKYVDNISSEKS